MPSTTSPVYRFGPVVTKRSSRVTSPTPTTQHAGGVGVERAGVADPSLAEPAPQHADDVVAGDAGRLVDDRQTVDGRRPTAGHAASACGRSVGDRRGGCRSMRSAALDHLVGPEVEDRRLLGRHLAADRRLEAPAVLVEHLEDLVVAVLAVERVEEHDRPVDLVVDVDRR